jgi:hypothetical protein
MKKPTFSLNQKDEALRILINKSTKLSIAQWALECAERVLPYYVSKFPADDRPQQALEALKNWMISGNFNMQVIRSAALASHAAAREVGEDSAARSAARAAGQAVSTAHVKEHALAAANYALQAIFRASTVEDADGAVSKERAWQKTRLDELRSQ